MNNYVFGLICMLSVILSVVLSASIYYSLIKSEKPNIVESWIYHINKISMKQDLYIHKAEDTNKTGFHVGEVKLHFLPAFSNPCFIELLGTNNSSVYSRNTFVQSTDYPRERIIKRGFKKLAKFPNGIPIPEEISTMINQNLQIQPNLQFRLRCLPYFHLLGMAKSGTTDLFKRMQLHPHIRGPNTKELFWWSQYRLRVLNASLSDYIDQFDLSLKYVLNHKHVDINSGNIDYPTVLGEFTPVTFSDDPLWNEDPRNEGEEEPKVLKIHDMYALNPNVKLIVLLRNPTMRLYSAYNMFRKGIGSPQDFHLRVIKSIEWWRNCTKILPIRACAYGSPAEMPEMVVLINKNNNRFPGPDMVPNYSGEIRKCMYVIFARDWLKVFPRENMLFLKTEEYTNNMGKIINDEIFPFLGLPKLDPTVTSETDDQLVMPMNRKIYKPMLFETRLILDSFFKSFNNELADLLNDEKWKWRR